MHRLKARLLHRRSIAYEEVRTSVHYGRVGSHRRGGHARRNLAPATETSHTRSPRASHICYGAPCVGMQIHRTSGERRRNGIPATFHKLDEEPRAPAARYTTRHAASHAGHHTARARRASRCSPCTSTAPCAQVISPTRPLGQARLGSVAPRAYRTTRHCSRSSVPPTRTHRPPTTRTQALIHDEVYMYA